MENRKKKKWRKGKVNSSDATIAAFFAIVVNGEVGPQIRKLLPTTYTVALQKDPKDLRKLLPIGIPSAIRQIAAALVVGK